MLKRILALGAAAAAALVAGCGDGPSTVTGTWRNPATWSTMIYASTKGPLLVEVHGDPFAAGAGFGQAVAVAMDNQVMGRPISFTADRRKAPRPQFRVVIAFNPPLGMDAKELCGGGQIAVTDTSKDRITLKAGFCDGETLLASVDGWIEGARDAGDKRFRQLLAQVVRELFGAPP